MKSLVVLYSQNYAAGIRHAGTTTNLQIALNKTLLKPSHSKKSFDHPCQLNSRGKVLASIILGKPEQLLNNDMTTYEI